MKKTVAITLITVLGACLIIFGSLVLFAPARVANFFDSVGFYNSSIRLYEKQYGKSDSIDDLAVLILKLDQAKDSEKIEYYGEIMIEHEDYAEYCKSKDKDAPKGSITTNEFYFGKYVVSLAKNDNITMAVSKANEFVLNNGYTDYNPFSVMISELGNELGVEKLNLIKKEILEYKEYLGGVRISALEADIDLIEQIIQQIENNIE